MATKEYKQVTDFDNYIGDVNLEYGGTFYNLEDWKYGYANFLEVIDLDSAAGVDDCVLIQRGSVYFDNAENVRQGFKCCGFTRKDLKGKDVRARKLWIVDAVKSYGHLDYDQCASWLVWQPFDESDTPPDAGAWHAELVKLHADQDLFEYILEEGYLGDFE